MDGRWVGWVGRWIQHISQQPIVSAMNHTAARSHPIPFHSIPCYSLRWNERSSDSIAHLLLGEARVYDIHDAVDSQRGLSNVRADDDLTT